MDSAGWFFAGIPLGVIVGVLIGYACGRGRITHKTHMVFPAVKDPLIIEVERAHMRH